MDNFIKVKDRMDLFFEMAETLVNNGRVSLVGELDLILELAQLFKTEYKIYHSAIEISGSYDREYLLTVIDDVKSNWNDLSVEMAYRKNGYVGVSGVVYYTSEVNEDFIKDVRSNQYIKDFSPVKVIFVEDDEFDEDEALLNCMPFGECDKCHFDYSLNGNLAIFTIPQCYDELIEEIHNLIDEYID